MLPSRILKFHFFCHISLLFYFITFPPTVYCAYLRESFWIDIWNGSSRQIVAVIAVQVKFEQKFAFSTLECSPYLSNFTINDSKIYLVLSVKYYLIIVWGFFIVWNWRVQVEMRDGLRGPFNNYTWTRLLLPI